MEKEIKILIKKIERDLKIKLSYKDKALCYISYKYGIVAGFDKAEKIALNFK